MRAVESIKFEGYLHGSEQPKQLTAYYVKNKTKNRILRVVDANNRDVLLLLSPVSLDNLEAQVHDS